MERTPPTRLRKRSSVPVNTYITVLIDRRRIISGKPIRISVHGVRHLRQIAWNEGEGRATLVVGSDFGFQLHLAML
jgi:hypothetical protein